MTRAPRPILHCRPRWSRIISQICETYCETFPVKLQFFPHKRNCCIRRVCDRNLTDTCKTRLFSGAGEFRPARGGGWHCAPAGLRAAKYLCLNPCADFACKPTGGCPTKFDRCGKCTVVNSLVYRALFETDPGHDLFEPKNSFFGSAISMGRGE